MKENRHNYRYPDWLYNSGLIDKQDRFGTRITQCLGRYYEVVKRGKEEIKELFTEKEIVAIVSAMISHMWSHRGDFLDREILINIEDSYPGEIHLEDELQKKVLENKIKELPYHLHVALAETVRDRINNF